MSRGKENINPVTFAQEINSHFYPSLQVGPKIIEQYLNLTNLIFVLLDKQGRVNQINQQGCAILGYKKNEIVGKNWFDHFIPTRIREEVKGVFNKLMAGEIAPVEFFENPVLTRQGEERIIAWHNTVVTNESGNIVGTLSSGADVTERRKTEKALRQSQQLLEKTLNSLQEAVFILDAETARIIDCNRAATEIFGFDREEMIGKTPNFLHIDEMAHQEFRLHLYEAIAKTGFLSNFEFRMKRKDGQVFPTEHSVTPILDEAGKRIAWVSVVRDITERKRTFQTLQRMNEELEQKVKAKTEELIQAYNQLKETEEQFHQAQKLESIGMLASGIAHDFNNFLATIMGNISLLRMMIEKELVESAFGERLGQMSELLNQVINTVHRAKELTGQLLTFAKDKKPVKRAVSTKKIIEDAGKISLGGAKINWVVSIPDGIWDMVADEGQIVQVINNLLINAREAMPEGGTIEVSCSNVEVEKESIRPRQKELAPGRYVKIAIKDTGVGIAQENLSRIFEPFWTTKPTGTGLGLACANAIVKKHNGIITVKSKKRKGTTFTIYLPAESSKPSTAGESVQEKSPLVFPKGVTRRILIMDDNKEILKTCQSILSYFGYEVECAEDGKEAIAKFQAAKANKPFDVVIMDLTVKGGMGGKETIGELLKIDPQVKAIVSSGYADEPIIANFSQYGFCARLCKPYEAEELVRTVEEALKPLTVKATETKPRSQVADKIGRLGECESGNRKW